MAKADMSSLTVLCQASVVLQIYFAHRLSFLVILRYFLRQFFSERTQRILYCTE